MGNNKLNKFIWIGFVLDLVGFMVALFLSYPIGIVMVLAGIVFTVIGLVVCLKQKSGVGTAIFYLVLDIAFLIWLLVM